MSEFVGVVLGVALGGGLMGVQSWRLRAALLVVALPVAGGIASAVNGELASGLWPLFVSFDTLLVGLGVALGLALARLPGAAVPAAPPARRLSERRLSKGP